MNQNELDELRRLQSKAIRDGIPLIDNVPLDSFDGNSRQIRQHRRNDPGSNVTINDMERLGLVRTRRSQSLLERFMFPLDRDYSIIPPLMALSYGASDYINSIYNSLIL